MIQIKPSVSLLSDLIWRTLVCQSYGVYLGDSIGGQGKDLYMDEGWTKSQEYILHMF